MKSDMIPIISVVGVGSLATINDDGSPWSTPLHVAVGDEVIVWLTSSKTQHSQNIQRDNRVSLALWSSSEIENVKGIYVQSRAVKVSGGQEIAARQLYAERFGGIPEKFLAGETYIAPLGDINTTKSRGGRIYFDG